MSSAAAPNSAAPLTLVPWEACVGSALPWSFYDRLTAEAGPVEEGEGEGEEEEEGRAGRRRACAEACIWLTYLLRSDLTTS